MPRETIASVKAAAKTREQNLKGLLTLEKQRNESLVSSVTYERTLREARDRQASDATRRLYRREERVRELENERKRLRREIANMQKQEKLPQDAEVLLANTTALLPDPVKKAFREVMADRSMRDVTEALMERGAITDPVRLLLAGVGMNPQARRHVNAALDAEWAGPRNPSKSLGNQPQIVIVGAGVHAAIFASVYHALTGRKPVVIDKKRAGGVFGVSENAAFYLNSRNRPGPLSIPGDEFGALNVLPGAPIQPSDLGGDEYLTNDALAWTVRMSLMMHATVFTGYDASTVSDYSSRLSVITANGFPVYPPVAVVAAGLTQPKTAFRIDDSRYLSFEQFMGRMDMMFPFQGMKRVAVLGAGDSGKTVIEALTGQGPSTRYSVPSLDFVEKIDWFGVPEDRRTREDWEKCNRSRYKGIGRLLPQNDKPYRVLPLPKPSFADMGYDCVKIDGMPYDFVIDCTGYENNQLDLEQWPLLIDTAGGGRAVARCRQGGINNNRAVQVAVGPAAKIPNERTDDAILNGIGENATSIFRYADRTARAAMLVAKAGL